MCPTLPGLASGRGFRKPALPSCSASRCGPSRTGSKGVARHRVLRVRSSWWLHGIRKPSSKSHEWQPAENECRRDQKISRALRGPNELLQTDAGKLAIRLCDGLRIWPARLSTALDTVPMPKLGADRSTWYESSVGGESMTGLKRITTDPAVMGGKPCIRGLRVTVGTIVGLVATGHPDEEILRLYPYLEADDIREALSYAAWRAEEIEVPLSVP